MLLFPKVYVSCVGASIDYNVLVMKKSDFYYDLPETLIAQHPSPQRDHSRLLYLNGADGHTEEYSFFELGKLLHSGDCLVLNDTRVIPARLIGEKEGLEHPVEFLLLKRLSTSEWEVIVRPGRRLRPGAHVVFQKDVLEADILEVLPGGNRKVRFYFQGIWEEVLDSLGQMPLPPYIHEKLLDKERYQTVYAVHEGSAAAPTAGLHFTKELLQELQDSGIRLAYVTLHVGLGTFRPVKEEDILDHEMHSEYYEIPEEACLVINETRRNGGRIISVGTTSCRVLESAELVHGEMVPGSGETRIFIYPGYQFKLVDCLITNFHLPESTLVMLVAALAGKEHILQAYAYAVEQKYRFFSFGDAMFIEGDPRNFAGTRPWLEGTRPWLEQKPEQQEEAEELEQKEEELEQRPEQKPEQKEEELEQSLDQKPEQKEEELEQRPEQKEEELEQRLEQKPEQKPDQKPEQKEESTHE